MAQGEANMWYTGTFAGVDFNTSPPTGLTNGQLLTIEGSSSLCNKHGNLLCYTEGINVYNKNHALMANGTGLLGDNSSTQAALIVENPDSAHLLYIFHVSAANGLCLSIVDTTLNGGLGAVTVKNILLSANSGEKVTAVKHSNGKHLWVVTHQKNNNIFEAFKVSNTGVSTTPVTSSGGYNQASLQGYLKFSPNGKKLVCVDHFNGIELFDFDINSGVVSNPATLSTDPKFYGAEFSPSGRFLYITSSYTSPNELFQYDMKAPNIAVMKITRVTIASFTGGLQPGGLQLAPDGKIYMARLGWDYLGVINEPEKKGTACDFVMNGVYLAGKYSGWGLPSFVQTIFYAPYVDAEFTKPTCGKLTFGFYNTEDTSFIIKSKWEFGDGTTDSGRIVTKTYASHGTYTVKNILYLGGNRPRTDTLVKIISTIPGPEVSINKTAFNPCFDYNHFELADSTKYPGTIVKKSSVWSYSDTGLVVYDLPNVVRSYATTGAHIVKLVVTASNNCADSTIDTLTVFPSANALFTPAGVRCLKNNQFTPVNNSAVAAPGAITGYLWRFGDGTTSPLASPAKKYNDTGTYPVQLIITEKNGCNDTFTAPFTVSLSPTPDFTINKACRRDSVAFTNTTTNLSGTIAYRWEFGDGGISTVFESKNLYNDTGDYHVKLVAVSDLICSDSIVKTIKINPNPVADFSHSGNCTENPTIFTDNSTRFGASVVNNQWTFGDGKSGSTASGIQHTFSLPGIFTTKLVTEDINECKDSISKPVFINVKPNIALTIADDEQCLKGNVFEFHETHNLYSHASKSILWYFDNDPGISTFPNLWRSFTQTGLHTLKIVIENDSGCRDSVIKNFTIHPQVKTNIALNDTAQCLKGNVFSITNTSVVNGSGTIKNYSWLFSDNTTATTVSPLPKTFGSDGLQWVQCIMETDQGCLDTFRQNLEVYFNPAINFSAQNVCLGNEVIFDNTTADPNSKIIKWQWDFGDGGKSALKNPVRKYSAAGNYLVNVIATTADGCADTLEKFFPNLVSPRPTAYFEDSVLGSMGKATMYRFTNGSTAATQYQWDFGDGTISNDEHPEKTYEDVGHFLVSLTAENQYGCKDQYSKNLFVVPDMEVVIPNAFTPNNQDNLNPVFKVEGLYLAKEFNMDIFNRWGECVFSTEKVNTGWDGTYAGQASPPGMYMYVIRVMDLKNKVNVYYGSFTVLR